MYNTIFDFVVLILAGLVVCGVAKESVDTHQGANCVSVFLASKL
jgi:hypothetical protein